MTKTSRSKAFPVGRRCNAVAPRVSHGPCQHRRRSVVKIRCRKLGRLASTSILHLWTDPTSEQSIRGGMRCSNAWSSLCWSLCNLTASARCLHAGSVHHFSSYASSSAASTPEENHEAVLHACQCLVCFVVYIPYHRVGMSCVCMSIFSFKQSLSTRHHTPYGRGQLLGDPRH